MIRGGGEEEGAELNEVASAELRPEAHSSHGRKEGNRVGLVRTRKVNKAPARLMKKMAEKRRHWESMQTLH